jgi:2-haloacid dehalogenase
VDRLRVLLFDVFGTLVDWRSSLIDIAAANAARAGLQADWVAIVDDWRPPRRGPRVLTVPRR